jgi:hypothetical protein
LLFEQFFLKLELGLCLFLVGYNDKWVTNLVFQKVYLQSYNGNNYQWQAHNEAEVAHTEQKADPVSNVQKKQVNRGH